MLSSSPGGVRIAAVTFNTQAELVYNFGDLNVDTVRKAKRVTQRIVYRGGGTATRSALKLIINAVPLTKGRAKALIVITDGKHNVAGELVTSHGESYGESYGELRGTQGLGSRKTIRQKSSISAAELNAVFT